MSENLKRRLSAIHEIAVAYICFVGRVCPT